MEAPKTGSGTKRPPGRRHGSAPSARQGPLIRRRSLHDQVAEEIRQLIVHGELPAGEKVPVAELADRLGVSPTPLREALKVLGEEGLVELTPNRGARVSPFTAEQAAASFEVIAGLESLAAELAARRMTDGDLAELEHLHGRMREAYAGRRRKDYFDLNSRIHDLIVALARNDVLTATHQRLLIRARRGRYMAIVDPQRWEEAVGEHDKVMQAFRRRDHAGAAAVWRLHLERSGQVMAQILQRQEAEGPGEG